MMLQGFGHLLPSSESGHILGIVYDSCTFPDHNRDDGPSTRLTVSGSVCLFDTNAHTHTHTV